MILTVHETLLSSLLISSSPNDKLSYVPTILVRGCDMNTFQQLTNKKTEKDTTIKRKKKERKRKSNRGNDNPKMEIEG